MQITVSVIIINYNTLQLTTNCIRSIIRHTQNVSYEIILVDNNSSECNMQLLTSKFPDIVFIQSTSNLGFAGGNNLGLANAQGEYILLLNSDTELVNDAISISVAKMQSDNKIGVLSTKLVYPDGRSQAVAGRFPSLKTELFELFRLTKFESEHNKRNRLHADLLDYSKYIETDWLWGAFLLMPHSVLNAFPQKKLHQDFFMYYEDVQWCYFIKHDLKLKIVYIPDGVVIHHIAGSSTVKDPWDNFKTKILPNQYKFLIQTHGYMYAYAYYLIKILHYSSLKGAINKNKAKAYFKFLFLSKK
jgi:GT2 family glycosyltransferase